LQRKIAVYIFKVPLGASFFPTLFVVRKTTIIKLTGIFLIHFRIKKGRLMPPLNVFDFKWFQTLIAIQHAFFIPLYMPAQPTGWSVARFCAGGIRKGIRAFKFGVVDFFLAIIFAFANAVSAFAFAMTGNISFWYM
jgi:hypothetical protein